MSPPFLSELEEFLTTDQEGVVAVPALLRGQLVRPPKVSAEALRRAAETGGKTSFRLGDAQVIRRPRFDPTTHAATGDDQFLVLPAIDPRELIETDPGELARDLYSLPFDEILKYVGALREALRSQTGTAARAERTMADTSRLAASSFGLVIRVLPELLDPEAFAEAVDRELSFEGQPGRRFLDGWVPLAADPVRGMTARIADGLFGDLQARRTPAALRALPTRQLHITAGNSPLAPLLSFVRALATKGAAVVKSPAESLVPAALLALAMRHVDPDHPITRHTSMVYWPGGDRRVENVLFAPGAFDRILVWGTSGTVDSVVQRAGQTKTIVLRPRYSLSLVGREAFAEDTLEKVVFAAVSDAMIANQQACISSLVTYVEADEEETLAFCRRLREALARWDEALPHRLPRETVGRLRRLRRQELLGARWFTNGSGRDVTSAVVYVPDEFDVALHPMARTVFVRRLDDLRQALAYLHPGVSAVGVYPEPRRLDLRDEIASRGVSNVFPLGECERSYPGMPHDGLRMLSEIVQWANA